MNTCLFDTEGPGLYAPSVVLQARFDYCSDHHDDKPFLYDLWRQPVALTLQLIEEIVSCRVVAHNITFDWQKITQFYNAIHGLPDCFRPVDDIDLMANRFYTERSKFCLKPPAAVDTMMLCQKYLGGSSLATKEFRVRKIPADLAPFLLHYLNQNTNLPDILFAKRQNSEPWVLGENDEGPEWNDLCLKFAPSNGLKEVAKFVLGVDDTQKIGADFVSPEYPYEIGYAPYAVMLNDGGWIHKWWDKDAGVFRDRKLWPLLLKEHLDFWTTPGTPQFKYALDDVVLLEKLYDHFDRPDTDFDSEVGCQVASVRVAGMAIDMDLLDEQIDESKGHVKNAQVNVNSHVQVRKYISDALDPMEALVIADGCDKAKLKSLTGSMVLEAEEECCDDGCPRCDFKGTVGPGPMPVVGRAQHILDVRKHKRRLQLYKKLTVSKGCYPSFRVIGTKSGRMSGADKLNYHGIDGSPEIRSIFTFAEDGWVVSGGDMNSQELAITAAVMKDENLGDVLRTNKKLHGIFAADASDLSYEQIMEHSKDKTRQESTLYDQGKVTCYSILYGASSFKVAMDLGCSVEEAAEKINKFFSNFPMMTQTRKMVQQSLEAIKSDADGRLQVGAPKQTYIESLFGYRRSFQTEYSVMAAMFHTMKQWRRDCKDAKKNSLSALDLKRKVIRKEKKGPQTLASVASSALYGALFSLQGQVLRAALNHLIQSAGRTCTLRVQKRIWDEVQPIGIHPFEVKLLSVHDEIATASPPENVPKIAQAVQDEMTALTEFIPLLSLDWGTDVGSWYGVKAAEEDLIRCGWSG